MRSSMIVQRSWYVVHICAAGMYGWYNVICFVSVTCQVMDVATMMIHSQAVSSFVKALVSVCVCVCVRVRVCVCVCVFATYFID